MNLSAATKVSVVVPVFDREPYVRESASSLHVAPGTIATLDRAHREKARFAGLARAILRPDGSRRARTQVA